MKIENIERLNEKIKNLSKIENIDLLNRYNNRIKENDKDIFNKYISQSRYSHNISIIEYINLRDYILSKKDLSKKYRILYNKNQSYFLSKENQYKIIDFIDIMNKILSKEIFDENYFQKENNIIEKIYEKMRKNDNEMINNENLIDYIYIDDYIRILFNYYIKKYNYKDLFIIEEKIEYYRDKDNIKKSNEIFISNKNIKDNNIDMKKYISEMKNQKIISDNNIIINKEKLNEYLRYQKIKENYNK